MEGTVSGVHIIRIQVCWGLFWARGCGLTALGQDLELRVQGFKLGLGFQVFGLKFR